MILVDVFEPDDIFYLLKQSVEVQRQNLVQAGFADYLFFACDGHRIQVERKQWGEVLSDPDHVEEQLRRELPAAEETVLLVEGVAEATAWGMDTYCRSADKPYFRHQHSYGTRRRPQPGLYHRIQSWFWQLDKAGVGVYRTVHSRDTAAAIASWYRSSQKEEHLTLKRYIRPRMQTKAFDPRVLTLMGMSGIEIGEVRAKALVEAFGSVWAVVNAGYSDLIQVEGIGPSIAKRLIEVVGRPYYD